MTNSFGEFESAKLFFLIGTNMTEAHPVASYFVKQAVKKGAKLIVVDPRQHALARRADIFAQLKVGTDVALLNGIMHVLIQEDLYDQEFVAAHCTGFDALKTKLSEYPPERAAEISGVPAETIREIARMLAAVRPGMLCYTLGLTEHTSGVDNVHSVANLQMLLGNLGMTGGGVNPLRGQNNVQGACDMGALPVNYVAYQYVNVPENREKFARAWGVESLPATPGLMMPEMMSSLQSGKVRGFFIVGENLAGTEPDLSHVELELSAAEFLVCCDIFPTETTRFAHVILPSASWGESEGTYTNSERRVSRVRAFKQAPGQARPGWWIAKEIARRMGHDWPSNSAREIWDNEVSALAPAYAGIKYARLEGDGLQWPCPNLDHPGTGFLHKDGKFSRGQGLFEPVEWRPPAEIEDDEYPFMLSTGRRLYHYHTRTQTARAGMDQMLSEETVDISPADADRLGISNGEMVRVSSRRGSVKVKARITEEVPAGLVWMAFHFREANANWLTNNAFDPVSKTAEYKASAVKIEKLKPNESVTAHEHSA
jgi:formate dehydrogenase major subunit